MFSLFFDGQHVSLQLFKEKHLKKQNKHITFKAKGLLLALLIFIAFGAKEWHIVVEHNTTLEICDAKQSDKHLHDYEHIQHGCSLCDFTFSLFELQLSSFQLKNLSDIFVKSEFAFISFQLSRSYIFQSLRAPPCFGFAPNL